MSTTIQHLQPWAPGGADSSPVRPVRVSLIIPAHNEALRLESTLRDYARLLTSRFGDATEILVVANACVDRTVAVASSLGGEMPCIRVIAISEPVGKGGAIMAGFREARGDAVVFADADGATSARSLLGLIEGLESHDVVIGSRRITGSIITRTQPWRRRLFSRIFNLTARAMFGLAFRDTQCGAKAFRADAASRLHGLVTEGGWVFDLDVLLCARRLGLSVDERAVVWGDIDGSRLGLVRTTQDVLSALRRLHRRHRSASVLLYRDAASIGPDSVVLQ